MGLTFLVLIAILLSLAALYITVRRSPTINVNLGPIRVEVAPPEHVKAALIPPEGEVIPALMLEYVNADSELWARVERKQHLIALKSELGSWELAFQQLQKEDNYQPDK